MQVIKAKPGCMWGYNIDCFGGILGMLKHAKNLEFRKSYGGWTIREEARSSFDVILRVDLVDSDLISELICDK